MIYVNSIETALLTIINSDGPLTNSFNANVDLNQIYNTDPNREPWIGIYTGVIDVEPHTVRYNSPWKVTVPFEIYVQRSNYQDTNAGHDDLHRILSSVLSAIDSNRTLDNTVNLIVGMRIEPFERPIHEDESFFTNVITLETEILL